MPNKKFNGLFEQIELLKKAGVGIIYISHRLEEVHEIGDGAAEALAQRLLELLAQRAHHRVPVRRRIRRARELQVEVQVARIARADQLVVVMNFGNAKGAKGLNDSRNLIYVNQSREEHKYESKTKVLNMNVKP